MKTKIFFLALISVVILASCGHDSGHLIGQFRVIKKEKANHVWDYGFVTLTKTITPKDTIKVLVSMEEEYLNVKIGDTYLVGKDRYGSSVLNNRQEKGVVGYAKVVQKMGTAQCKVATRGQDTILVALIAEASISEGGFVLVKKNRDQSKKPHYFVK